MSESPVNSDGHAPEPPIQTRHLVALAEMPREGAAPRRSAAAGGDPTRLSHRPRETTAGPCAGLSEARALRPVEAQILLASARALTIRAGTSYGAPITCKVLLLPAPIRLLGLYSHDACGQDGATESHRRCGWQLWDGLHVPYLPAGMFGLLEPSKLESLSGSRTQHRTEQAGWWAASLPVPKSAVPRVGGVPARRRGLFFENVTGSGSRPAAGRGVCFLGKSE